ncbi:MAG TPA: hypothetical protein DHN33_10525, partial [Eubacteriaceae bacterium]|nr:hypothetical protein [Eubacteriaceae bacterium]
MNANEIKVEDTQSIKSAEGIHMEEIEKKEKKILRKRLRRNRGFHLLFGLATILSIIVLITLLYRIFSDGAAWLGFDFLTNNL